MHSFVRLRLNNTLDRIYTVIVVRCRLRDECIIRYYYTATRLGTLHLYHVLYDLRWDFDDFCICFPEVQCSANRATNLFRYT